MPGADLIRVSSEEVEPMVCLRMDVVQETRKWLVWARAHAATGKGLSGTPAELDACVTGLTELIDQHDHAIHASPLILFRRVGPPLPATRADGEVGS